MPVEIHQALLTVEGIHKGREPRVTEPRKVWPAPDEHVEAVLGVAPPQIKAMIELQRLTGMRPDEVTIMRPGDIDRTGEIWLYVPEGHKMEYKDIAKRIRLGYPAGSFYRSNPWWAWWVWWVCAATTQATAAR